MPSHLTRQVFRRLLANEPIVHRGCLRRQAYSSATAATALASRPRRQNGFPAVRPAQRRTFFNFNMFRKAKRELKEADMDPGIEKMMELEKMQRMRARLPHPEDVAKALRKFFAAKLAQKKPLEDTQAQLALQSIKYCIDSQSGQTAVDGEDVAGPILSTTFFTTAAKAARAQPKRISAAHIELAQVLYRVLLDARSARSKLALEACCMLLSNSGSPQKARELLVQHEKTDSAESPLSPTEAEEASAMDDAGEIAEQASTNFSRTAWRCVLVGFALKQDEPELKRTLAMMGERGLDRGEVVAGTMMDFYVSQDNAAEVRSWWERYRQVAPVAMPRSAMRDQATGKATYRVLRWCIRSGNLEFGHQIVTDVMRSNPSKPVWDSIFVWAAGTGKGVDEIGRMVDVMERSNEAVPDQAQWRVPDTATINALVEFAISKDDPYMAERFIALGRERGIEPDARTYVLQMDYRLSVNDVDGALTAYKNLQAMDLSEGEDLPVVNKLVVALCSSKRHDFDTIMNVAADLSDRRARFEPLTVATLSLLHLNRDELHDVIDLLNTHAFHYSSTERASIRDAMIAYCLDPATPTSRSWDAYTILRNVFDELTRASRTELMINFITRERPDMAVHVFNHMRQHSRADTMPTRDTYIAAFMGTARLGDLESLEVVHNQLKLDFNIEINTLVRNALVIAYTACGRPRKALGFWDEVVASREGPSYNSVHVALRACEKSPYGDLKAREIWALLGKQNVELDGAMWASYVAALAGNGEVRQAMQVVEAAEGKGEVEVDVFLLGSLFAGAPGMGKQGEVEGWGRERYPGVWAELVKTGVQEDEAGNRLFGVDRRVAP
ncbi:hypothetical protein LTR36_010448 [Oleoguttula mirabilis]|uniref:Complex I intermediate-associated protein 84 n=1 Tax=Oleoguttula mirabilis TaxID=1507867 RepID=A0AAV9J4P6_9PEZI|nr:hypothetical protein LTR36_010448 [Oleoguttula mirabilis]